MRSVRLWQLGAALFCALSCHTDVRSTDGSTSWMSMCMTVADCSDGLACECGVCTNVCAMDVVCGSSASACAKAGSSAFNATCGESSTLAGVCLPKCPKEGCGTGRVCSRGLCTLSPSANPQTDAGPSSDAPSGTGGTTSEGGNGSGGLTIGDGGATGGGVAVATGGGVAVATGGRSTGVSAGGSVSVPEDAAPDGNIGPLATCDSFNDPGYRNGPIISFRNDILPMFGLSCVVSDCHSPQDHKAGLNLGYKCAYDQNAKWKCTFPSVPDPDLTKPQPEDEQTVADIYASLLAPAMTVSGGSVERVAPGDPSNSFLVLSLADKQNSRGYACINQDISHESNPPPCGVSMPQNGDYFCDASNQTRFDAVVRWIAQGARNN